ncbi:hypothetical protein PsorP6_006494 [Peronosclerospora sorghi]|uniref:Uncharacterized protein n=1 Tax=Peronosclerospora sorghi TaxID=230839 RepID=A0ACC0W2C4_9STRA|nr:hypothetical protein PsorP6_006494 [Peronosclerospora sorghi]
MVPHRLMLRCCHQRRSKDQATELTVLANRTYCWQSLGLITAYDRVHLICYIDSLLLHPSGHILGIEQGSIGEARTCGAFCTMLRFSE